VNENDWLTSTDPQPMLEYLGDQMTSRKLRLFAVACCRRMWPLLTDARSRACVEVAERFADGEATDDELQEAYTQALFPVDQLFESNEHHSAFAALCASRTAIVSSPALDFRSFTACDVARDVAGEVLAAVAERKAQCRLLRDIFVDPFRPVTLDHVWVLWNGGAVRKIAEAIYGERDFQRLPILADALMEAGCADATVLDHCRSESVHVRGCWLVDFLLGKE
jgi:hypothetical protein